MSDLSDVFYSTERFGRTVPETATFELEETALHYRVSASITIRSETQGFEFLVTRVKPIRDADDHAERSAEDIQAQLLASVRALAFACIDAGPLPRRHVNRPFAARGA